MLLQFLVTIFLLILLPLLFLITVTKLSYNSIPKSYPLVGSFITLSANRNRRLQWLSDILQASHSATYVLRRSYATRQFFTGNLAVVQRILKTHFNPSIGVHVSTMFQPTQKQGSIDELAGQV